MEIKEISTACEKISLKGLTREIICDLLEIYNKNKVPESHSKCYAGSGIRVDATSLKRIVASFGLGFTNDEVTRAIISFSRGDALTFSDFLKFYLWYVPVYQKIRNKTKAVLEKSSDGNLESDIEKLVKNSKLVDENMIGFILEDFRLFYKNAFKPKSSKLVEQMMDDLNQLPYKYNFSRKDNIRPYIRFDITLMNIFGLIPYEYIGIESDLPSLDVFIQVELCNQTFKSSVFPARYSPSISQTFSFEFNSPSEMSFLDASWWIQNAKLKISVYAVHYLDISVAFHLLGSANQPLLPLLIDQHGRTTCTINLQALTPTYPIPILVSITNICKEADENEKTKTKVKIKKENDQKVVNPLIYHSAPIEQLIFEKFLRQIRDNLTNLNGLSKQNFIGYCNYFKEISVRFPAREYQLLGFDEMNVAHFINTYLYNDGILLKTTRRKNNKIYHNVEQLIYIVSLLGSTVFDRPEPEVMQIRNLITTKTCKLDPNIMERALLLCNLFTAYGVKSYVCIGDHQFQRYVWVMTPSDALNTDRLPDFMMFDCGNKAYTISSFINHKYEFPTTSAIDRIDGQQQIIFSHGINPLLLGINSISSVAEEDQYFDRKNDNTRNLQSKMRHWSVSGIWPDRVPCGLKVATVFDSKNIYCNIQENDDIEVVDWDLNNSTFWAPFYKNNNLTDNNVYDKRFYERMLKKPEFVFTDEEKTNMDKLLFQKKFNMFKKNCIKNSFDKYTRDTFQFNIDFEDMFSFRKVYQDQNFFENYYKSHLNSLLETQLLLNLTPVERQILNTFLICKDKHQTDDKEIEFGDDDNDDILLNFFSTKKERKQIGLKQKRFKILLKSQNDEERSKINSIIRHINLSMMKLNSNGHAKFIESESITRFLYAFENLNSKFKLLKDDYNENRNQTYNNSILKEITKEKEKDDKDQFFFEKLKKKELLSEEDIEICNKYLLNFQLDYLHLINSYDKYNDEEFRPIFDIFNNSLSNVKNRIEELTRKISKNFDKDDFYILMKKMIQVDPEFLIYSEIIQKNGNVEKELSNYISSKVSKSEYLILEIFLQRCESLANQSDEFDQNEINFEEKEKKSTNSSKDSSFYKVVSDVFAKSYSIYTHLNAEANLINDKINELKEQLNSQNQMIDIEKEDNNNDSDNDNNNNDNDNDNDDDNDNNLGKKKLLTVKFDLNEIAKKLNQDKRIKFGEATKSNTNKTNITNNINENIINCEFFNHPIYIPESLIKKELVSILREEKDSIYQFYSVELLFESKFPAWNPKSNSHYDIAIQKLNEDYIKKGLLTEEQIIKQDIELHQKNLVEEQYKQQKILDEKLEILSLVEMLLEIFYKVTYNFQTVFIKPVRVNRYNKEIKEIILNRYHKDIRPENCINYIINRIFNNYVKYFHKLLQSKDSDPQKYSIKMIIDNYRLIFACDEKSSINEFENLIDSNLAIFHSKPMKNYIKSSISHLIKKALTEIRKNPRYALPLPEDWFIRCNLTMIISIAKDFILKMSEPDSSLYKKFDSLKFIEEKVEQFEAMNIYKSVMLKSQHVLANKLSIKARKIKELYSRQNTQYQCFYHFIGELFKYVVSDKELVEFRIFRQNIGVFKALQNVLDKVIKLNYESDDILDQLYYIIGQKVPEIEQSIEEFNKDLLEKLIEQYEYFIDNDELKIKKKLIKKRIESFRLTKRLIKECTNVDNKSTSYKIPKEIIIKPPELVESYPNSMSNFFMTCRLIIDHIMHKPFYFLFFNNKSIKKKQQQQQQPTQLTILQQKEEEIKEIQEQEQIRTKTLDSMLDLRNKMMIQKENRIKRIEQRKNLHQDIESKRNDIANKLNEYENQVTQFKEYFCQSNSKNTEAYKKNTANFNAFQKKFQDDENMLIISDYNNEQNISIDDKNIVNEFWEKYNSINNQIDSISRIFIKSYSSQNINKPVFDNAAGGKTRARTRTRTLFQNLKAPTAKSFQQDDFLASNQVKKTLSKSQAVIHPSNIESHYQHTFNWDDFKYLTNNKKKKELLKKRWESRQKVRDIIKSIHLFDEKVVPYISFDTKKDRYIDYINMVKTEPGIEFNENQKKELNNLLHLDVAMSTSSSLLIFHKKWSEERLIKKIQKTLLSFEEEIISKGRYDMNKLRTIVNKSIRSHRCMLRVSRHKIDEPNNLADQLSLSGALTSSCGAEKCIIVAQPFRYILDARSTWIVLLFIYKVPDNLTFSKKENVK